MKIARLLPCSDYDELPLDRLPLPQRVIHTLERNDLLSICDLRGTDVDSLLSLYGFGPGAAVDIVRMLRVLRYSCGHAALPQIPLIFAGLSEDRLRRRLLQDYHHLSASWLARSERNVIAPPLPALSSPAIELLPRDEHQSLDELLAVMPVELRNAGPYGEGALIELITIVEEVLSVSDPLLTRQDAEWMFGPLPAPNELEEPPVAAVDHRSTAITPEDGDRPLEWLLLPPKTAAQLKSAEFRTVGDLLALDMRLLKGRGFSSDLYRRIDHCRAQVLASRTPDGAIGWVDYWQSSGFHQAAADILEIDAVALLAALPRLLESLLATGSDGREWNILAQRYAPQEADRRTLEAIGEDFGLTRERVRQIEARALGDVRQLLRIGIHADRRIMIAPHLLDRVVELFGVLRNLTDHGIRADRLASKLQSTLELCSEPSLDWMPLIAALLDLRLERPAGMQPYWIAEDVTQRQMLLLRVRALHEVLLDHPAEPLTDAAALARLNQRLPQTTGLDLDELSRLIALCSTAQRRPDGRLEAPLALLRNRRDQAVRVLTEHGAPLEVDEIVYRINVAAAAFGARTVGKPNLSNQLINDPRCMPIGRSGVWKLSSWQHVSAESVVDLMQDALRSAAEPLTADQIYDCVSASRPLSHSSIGLYLATRPDLFRRVDFDRWALSDQPVTGPIWDRASVGEFVSERFAVAGSDRLPFDELVDALSEAAGIAERRAAAILGHHPVVRTYLSGGDLRIAVYQPLFRRLLNRPRIMRRKRIALFTRIQSAAHDVLRNQPQAMMPLRDLVQRLVTDFGFVRASIYSALQRDRRIRKVTEPGAAYTACVLLSPRS